MINSEIWYTSPEGWLAILAVPTLVLLWYQARETARAARAAKASADATSLNARAFMNIERAWVFVDIEHDSQKWADRKVHILEGSGTGGDTTGFYAAMVCKNEGRSPAWLEERRATFAIVETPPSNPNWDAVEIVETSPVPLGTGQAQPHTERLSFQAIAQGHEQLGKMSIIYGVVKYRDIFGEKRRTTFGYRITPDRKFVRLEYPGYNDHT